MPLAAADQDGRRGEGEGGKTLQPVTANVRRLRPNWAGIPRGLRRKKFRGRCERMPQRGIGFQPKVGRNELPWATVRKWKSNLTGCDLLPPGWVKHLDVNPEGFGKYGQLLVGDTAESRFNLRESSTTHFQSTHRTTGSKHLLREALLVAQFANLRPNNVL